MNTKLISLLAVALLSACDLTGCAALKAAGPTLGAVVSRVDVARLLECASAGPPEAMAKCLGARVLTEGLRLAMEDATRLASDAELAAVEGAGAADYTDSDRASLAAELDKSMQALGVELDKANGFSGAR